MAKAKTQTTRRRKAESPDDARYGTVDEQLAVLRKYHALGERALGRAPDGSPGEGPKVATLVAETGHTRDLVHKARLFASRYSREDLEDLFELRTPAGRPLTWNRVQKLIRVRRK